MAKAKETPDQKPDTQKSELFDLEGNKLESVNPEDMLPESYDGPQFIANYNAMNPEFSELAFMSQEKGTVEVGSKLAEAFPVQFWSIQKHHRFKDDEGNVKSGVRLCLVSPDRETLIINSDVALQFWGMVLGMRKYGPWSPPIHVAVVERKSGAGRRMYTLRLTHPKP